MNQDGRVGALEAARGKKIRVYIEFALFEDGEVQLHAPQDLILALGGLGVARAGLERRLLEQRLIKP